MADSGGNGSGGFFSLPGLPDLSKLDISPQGRAEVFGSMLDTVSTIAKHQAIAQGEQNSADAAGSTAAPVSKANGKDAMTPFDLLQSLITTGGPPTQADNAKASKTGNMVKVLKLLGVF